MLLKYPHELHRYPHRRAGLLRQCKICVRERMFQWRGVSQETLEAWRRRPDVRKNNQRIRARFARWRAKRARLVAPRYLQILYAVQRRRCAYCGRKLTHRRRRLDHIRPRRLLGEHARGNLCWICLDCNSRKNCDIIESSHPKYQKAAKKFIEGAAERAARLERSSETTEKPNRRSLHQWRKRCTTCGQLKDRSEFHREAKQKDGLRSQCKKCNLARNRNRDQKRASDARREAQIRYERQFGELSKYWVRQAQLVTGAYLTTLYQIQGEKCAYCRRTLSLRSRHLDHVQPLYRRGHHVRENVCWACTRCNYEKLYDVHPRYLASARRFISRAIRLAATQTKTAPSHRRVQKQRR